MLKEIAVLERHRPDGTRPGGQHRQLFRRNFGPGPGKEFVIGQGHFLMADAYFFAHGVLLPSRRMALAPKAQQSVPHNVQKYPSQFICALGDFTKGTTA